MPRSARENLHTSFFHVIVQGINKSYIFEADKYKEEYLKFIKQARKKYNIEIISYCIMSNHAHLLIYSNNVNSLSMFMKEINESYAKYYNYKENRVGYVFKSLFKSEPVINQKYLLNCIAYIHNNPVKSNMVEECEKYEFSSYREYLKEENFINNELIELIFGTKKLNIEEFKRIHKGKTYYFMEDNDNIDENMKEIIVEFENMYEMQWKEIIKDKMRVKDILFEIKERMKISNNRLAKYFGINRCTIDRIINR